MDDEDDDLYDPSDSFPQHHDQNGHGQTDAPGNSLEAEEYNEEEDDDDVRPRRQQVILLKAS
jgi:hypothetical protein